ncbi:ribonuclease J [Alphaproteobacteria bacterium endosymbiont of Tiliacea citrago]|uniref:ribonuclease J n=1 Tax=Alphaproteobacteria bacterium endosymbiont of Tiliacea citrago TaxID=3077944 RepID=UPI00313EAACD
MAYQDGAIQKASKDINELNSLLKDAGVVLDDDKKKKVNVFEDGVLKMVPLAGAEEIGMNMTVYFYQKNNERFAILVDCGVTFEELPGASVSMPNLSVLKDLGIKINAIVITHGHEDHIGALPYLYDHLQVPIYATSFTAELIKKKMDYIRKKNYKVERVVAGETRELGPFKIQWINATHSIPDNTMLAIEVDGIRVLHTGDWKDDPSPLVGRPTDFKSIQAFSSHGVQALVSDSTNIHQDNPAVSELTVAKSLKDLVLSSKKGRFVLTCFASNVSRIQGCFEAARAAGRKILVLGTSLKKSVEISANLNYIKDDLLVSDEEANSIAPENLMIISTGSQAEENSALWKMANEMRSAGSILEKNDTLVFSARVIDGRQKAVRKIINKLVEKGVKIIHPWNSESCIHASGHPSKPDVAKLLDIVKPACVIPVHCEAEHRVSHIAFAKSKGFATFNLRNGVIISITKKGVFKFGAVETKKLVVDGSRLVDETSEVFLKRSELNSSGMVAVSVGLRGKVLISMLSNIGVFDDKHDVKNKDTLNKHLKIELDRLLKSCSINDFLKKGAHKNLMEVRKKIIYMVKKFVWNHIKKNPIVNVQILA